VEEEDNPLNNPAAPAGPFFMSAHRSAKTDEAARLNALATSQANSTTKVVRGGRAPRTAVINWLRVQPVILLS